MLVSRSEVLGGGVVSVVTRRLGEPVCSSCPVTWEHSKGAVHQPSKGSLSRHWISLFLCSQVPEWARIISVFTSHPTYGTFATETQWTKRSQVPSWLLCYPALRCSDSAVCLYITLNGSRAGMRWPQRRLKRVHHIYYTCAIARNQFSE